MRSKKIAAIMIIILGVLSGIAVAAEWLGVYVGSEIPGYVILKSGIVEIDKTGGPTAEHTPNLDGLVEACKKHNGKAIVNVRFIYSLGDVSWKDNSGSIQKISPGAYGFAYGDCVSEVKAKK